jgi:large subunit ribosomal protein L24
MLHKRISKKFKTGDKVTLLVGAKQYKGKEYTIKSIVEDRVILDGYKTVKRTQKLSQENSENYKTVDIPVHISNIACITTEGKPSKVGFKIDGEKKVRLLKKTGETI